MVSAEQKNLRHDQLATIQGMLPLQVVLITIHLILVSNYYLLGTRMSLEA